MDVELDGSNRVYPDAESAQLECEGRVVSIKLTFATRVSARAAFADLQNALKSGREMKVVLQAARRS